MRRYLGPSSLLALIATLARPASPAHSQVIRGVVIDVASRAPVVGATVEVTAREGESANRATTDSLGMFRISVPGAGVYALQARRLGFLTAAPDTLRLGRDETITVELRLDARAVPLEPMVVTVRGSQGLTDFQRRRAAAFGRFLGPKEIGDRPGMRTTDLFRLTPGLVLMRQPRGPGSVLMMRGTVGLCQPAVWIDGMYVAMNVTGATLDDFLSPQVLEGVEIYNSVAAAPTQYRTGSCGVVLFWTKRGGPAGTGGIQWKKLVAGAGAAAFFIYLLLR